MLSLYIEKQSYVIRMNLMKKGNEFLFKELIIIYIGNELKLSYFHNWKE